MMKNISEKQHAAFERSLENVSFGKIHSFYFPAWCLSPVVNTRSACHFSMLLCWNSSLGAALLFSFEFQPLWSKQKGKELPVCYLLYSPVLFSSDEWDAISILYMAREMQRDWKPFESLLKSISQFCGFGVMTKLPGCGKCYFQKFSALCAGHIKESSCFLASRMEFLLSSWNAILQWSENLEL